MSQLELPRVHKEDEERTALVLGNDGDDDDNVDEEHEIIPLTPRDEAPDGARTQNYACSRCIVITSISLNIVLGVALLFLLLGSNHTNQRRFRLGLIHMVNDRYSSNDSLVESSVAVEDGQSTSQQLTATPQQTEGNLVTDIPTKRPTSRPTEAGPVTTSSTSSVTSTSATINSLLNNNERKFYIHNLPAMTTELIYDPPGLLKQATDFVESSFNEDLGELWLHQGFERSVVGKTNSPIDADVFIAPAYFYLSHSVGDFRNETHLQRVDRMLEQLEKNIDSIVALKRDKYKDLLPADIFDWNMTTIIMSPSTNAPMANTLAISKLVRYLQGKIGKANVLSLTYERNEGWAGGNSLENVIVAPYVVKPSLPHDNLASAAFTNNTRKDDFVFYLANSRKNAIGWAGCNRSMVLPLKDEPNMKVGLDESVPQAEFQRYMLESDYCLITCGDTPTSRRLTDSMVFGCIPIFIGTRLFGECIPPCKQGWGWSITNGLAHLPFEDQIPWHEFPVVDEAAFAHAPKQVLEAVFSNLYKPKETNAKRNYAEGTVLIRIRLGLTFRTN